VLVHRVAVEILFRLSRRNPDRMVRAWAIILPTDVAMVMMAAATDHVDPSPMPMVAVASVFSASIMFRPRYAVALGTLAAGGTFAADAVQARGPIADVAFPALIIFVVSLLAAARGRAEERLRRRLVESEQRERDLAAAALAALDTARVSEARFEAFSRFAPAIFLLFDRHGNAVFASEQINSVMGFDVTGVNEDVNKSTRVAKEDRRRFRQAINDALAGKPTTIEFAVTDNEGGPRRASCAFFPIKDGAGAIVLDVTAERTLAAQVVRAQQLETIGTIAGGIAHDFNNLLTALLGNLFLADANLPPESAVRPFVEDARIAAERGAELVRQLLDYSRPRIDQLETVSLAHLLDETARLSQHALPRTINLSVEAPAPEEVVQASFGALQQVLLNLIVNARDAMPGGGRVALSCRVLDVDDGYVATNFDARPGRFYAIDVADTGTGMPPAVLSRVFDPFFTTKEAGKGSGLGLATAQSILRAHGGWIDVRTAEGEGSTFSVVLPVPKPGDTAPAPVAALSQVV